MLSLSLVYSGQRQRLYVCLKCASVAGSVELSISAGYKTCFLASFPQTVCCVCCLLSVAYNVLFCSIIALSDGRCRVWSQLSACSGCLFRWCGGDGCGKLRRFEVGLFLNTANSPTKKNNSRAKTRKKRNRKTEELDWMVVGVLRVCWRHVDGW
jgi:hypothetical protein